MRSSPPMVRSNASSPPPSRGAIGGSLPGRPMTPAEMAFFQSDRPNTVTSLRSEVSRLRDPSSTAGLLADAAGELLVAVHAAKQHRKEMNKRGAKLLTRSAMRIRRVYREQGEEDRAKQQRDQRDTMQRHTAYLRDAEERREEARRIHEEVTAAAAAEARQRHHLIAEERHAAYREEMLAQNALLESAKQRDEQRRDAVFDALVEMQNNATFRENARETVAARTAFAAQERVLREVIIDAETSSFRHLMQRERKAVDAIHRRSNEQTRRAHAARLRAQRERERQRDALLTAEAARRGRIMTRQMEGYGHILRKQRDANGAYFELARQHQRELREERETAKEQAAKDAALEHEAQQSFHRRQNEQRRRADVEHRTAKAQTEAHSFRLGRLGREREAVAERLLGIHRRRIETLESLRGEKAVTDTAHFKVPQEGRSRSPGRDPLPPDVRERVIRMIRGEDSDGEESDDR